MRAVDLYAHLRKSHYQIFRKVDDRLGIRGPRPLSPDIMAQVRRFKRELIELVATFDAIDAQRQDRCARNTNSPGVLPSDIGCHTDSTRANGSSNRSTKRNGFPPIPTGWQRAHWVERLRYLAERCESLVPDRAEWLRQWALQVEQGRSSVRAERSIATKRT